MAKTGKDELNDKQRLFCQEYLIDLNATQSAIRAGYSPKTANEIGCENLAKPNIQRCIQELMQKRSEETGITAKRVLEELAKLGFSNMQDFTDNSNGIANINNLDSDKGACISSIETMRRSIGDGEGEIVITKLKLHDKLSALEKIAKHIGFFSADNSQKNVMISPNIIMSKK